MIKLDSQLHIQIDDLATAQVGLSLGSNDLLDGNLKHVKWSETSARGEYSLPSGASFQLDLVLKPLAPQAVSVKTTLTNVGKTPLSFDRFDAPQIHLGPALTQLPIWTLQGAAVAWGQDFAFELPRSFKRDNFLGHLQDGEGGGIPLVYFWNKTQGVALMHIEPAPKDWYMPVAAGQAGVSAALARHAREILDRTDQDQLG